MAYQPKQGDIIWITLDPQRGHEEMGRRPALVISGNDALKLMPGLAAVCPISNTDSGFPTHVPLAGHTGSTTGFVFAEQFKSLDIIARNAAWKDHVSDEALAEVLDIVRGILE